MIAQIGCIWFGEYHQLSFHDFISSNYCAVLILCGVRFLAGKFGDPHNTAYLICQIPHSVPRCAVLGSVRNWGGCAVLGGVRCWEHAVLGVCATRSVRYWECAVLRLCVIGWYVEKV